MKTITLRIGLSVPVTDEELYDLCVRSNGEGELDQIGCGYNDVQLTSDEVKRMIKDKTLGIVDDGYLFIAGEDLEKDHDVWFIEKKKEKYGRYDYDPLFDESEE